jgi:sugar O-acyltransferase (sialic acid O-acetyltransferase NeuD family)
MNKDIVIIGSGGHAKEIALLIEGINANNKTWNILGYIEKARSDVGKINGRYEVIDDESFFNKCKGKINVAIAVGSPMTVKTIQSRLKQRYSDVLLFPNLIHPSVKDSIRDVRLGHGNLFCAGNIFTTDILIGSFNCINRSCNISHDTIIKDYCVINPGVNISGGVAIESTCLIGTGATILQYLTIGEKATVGAGAVVTKNVEKGKTVVGIPAKPID